MQTTIDIDEDILQAARDRADATGRTTGEVISELARFALISQRIDRLPTLHGFPQLDFDPTIVVTPALVDQILDEED
jgi:hypothetical protein